MLANLQSVVSSVVHAADIYEALLCLFVSMWGLDHDRIGVKNRCPFVNQLNLKDNSDC